MNVWERLWEGLGTSWVLSGRLWKVLMPESSLACLLVVFEASHPTGCAERGERSEPREAPEREDLLSLALLCFHLLFLMFPRHPLLSLLLFVLGRVVEGFWQGLGNVWSRFGGGLGRVWGRL